MSPEFLDLKDDDIKWELFGVEQHMDAVDSRYYDDTIRDFGKEIFKTFIYPYQNLMPKKLLERLLHLAQALDADFDIDVTTFLFDDIKRWIKIQLLSVGIAILSVRECMDELENIDRKEREKETRKFLKKLNRQEKLKQGFRNVNRVLRLIIQFLTKSRNKDKNKDNDISAGT